MKKFLLLSVGLLAGYLSFPQTPHTLLWKISGKDLAKPSYLFGTMHIMCPEDARLSDSLKAAINACDEVYFEIKLDDMSALMGSIQWMMMKDGQRLSDLLKPEEYARIKDHFTHHPPMLPFGILERLKPMMASALIEEEGMDCKATDGMEMTIMKELKPLNKEVFGLETVEFQLKLFDSIPYKTQAKALIDYVDSVDQNKIKTRELIDLYKRQDLDALSNMTSTDVNGMSEYMDLLLYDRNRKWAKELNTLLPQKSLLIAVGAAHLPGDNGVINLLRKEGYTVTPVKN